MKVHVLCAASLAIGLSGLIASGYTGEELLTKGKLEADLGNFGTACSFYEKAIQDLTMPDPARWEAMIRLATTRDALGDRAAARAALAKLFDRYGNDDDARRYMLSMLTGIQVSDAHWQLLASRFSFSVPPSSPEPFRIDWTDFDPGACALPEGPGKPVSIDFLDADLGDVLDFLRVFGEVPIATDPCLEGMMVTLRLKDQPWDQVLGTMAGAYGLSCSYVPDQGFRLGCGPLAPTPEMTQVQEHADEPTCPLSASAGIPPSLHFEGAPSVSVLRTIADASGGWVQVDDCVAAQAANHISLDMEKVDHDGLEKLIGSLVRMNRLNCRQTEGRLVVGCLQPVAEQ